MSAVDDVRLDVCILVAVVLIELLRVDHIDLRNDQQANCNGLTETFQQHTRATHQGVVLGLYISAVDDVELDVCLLVAVVLIELLCGDHIDLRNDQRAHLPVTLSPHCEDASCTMMILFSLLDVTTITTNTPQMKHIMSDEP